MSAARPSAAEALAEARLARQEIDKHEDICAIRYAGIEAAITTTNDSIKETNSAVKELRGWLIGTFVTVLLMVLTMLGFIFVRYFDAVTKPPVQAVQVQTTVK